MEFEKVQMRFSCSSHKNAVIHLCENANSENLKYALFELKVSINKNNEFVSYLKIK